ncbi:MAG: peptidyl-prolyl cis-trans isomerase [Gammaproteobacteria bacterium]|nr:peptidyl-prolyl cis-trans isomerase [Gammaproteobacteria bacterium]
MLTQNKIIGLIFFVLFLVMLAASYRSGDSSIVATVAQQPISVSELKSRMIQRSGGMTQYFSSYENKKVLLHEMIDRELQIVSAKQAGYEKDPEIISAFENILIKKFRSDHLEIILKEVTIDNYEIQNYYQSNIKKYTMPAKVRVAIIHLKLSSLASKEKQAEVKIKAEAIYKLAKTLPESVKGFGSLAAKYSEDQATRYIGGDIGWLIKGKAYNNIDYNILQSIEALKNKNELAPVIKAKDGFYLVKLIEEKPQQQQPLKRVEQSIRQVLHRQKSKTAEADWLQSLKNRVTPIIINHTVLESVEPPPSTKQLRDEMHPPELPK